MFSDILQKYSSVDTQFGTDKITSHSYQTIYDELFSKYQNTCSKLLEIGFDGGFALQAYSEYFPNAEIYGIDIKDIRNETLRVNSKVKVHIGDACSQATVNHFSHEYDIIIEDASHLPEHQIQHFVDYNKYVKVGGIYIIEDIHEDALGTVLRETSRVAEANGFTYKVHNLRHIKNRFDDILIVFTKDQCVTYYA